MLVVGPFKASSSVYFRPGLETEREKKSGGIRKNPWSGNSPPPLSRRRHKFHFCWLGKGGGIVAKLLDLFFFLFFKSSFKGNLKPRRGQNFCPQVQACFKSPPFPSLISKAGRHATDPHPPSPVSPLLYYILSHFPPPSKVSPERGGRGEEEEEKEFNSQRRFHPQPPPPAERHVFMKD